MDALENKKKGRNPVGLWVFVLFFFGITVVPGLGMALGALGGQGEQAPVPVANERVVPVPRLVLKDGSFNQKVCDEISAYFSHHMAFRRELITGDSLVKAKVFHTSSQKQVALGQGDWLFYQETLLDYTGARTVTPAQAADIARSLSLARDYVEEKGGVFLFTCAPNKLSLYPAQLGQGLERAEKTGWDQVKEALDREQVPTADLFSAFLSQEEILYHRGDSHWTNRGAALAHDTILEALGRTGSAFDKPGTTEKIHQGDLHVMLYPASSQREEQFVFQQPPAVSYEPPMRSPEDLRIETTGPGSGRLLLFRDSFGNTLHPLLGESFATALFSRSIPYNLGLMEAVEADTVVVEIVERNLPRLREQAMLFPAPSVETVPEAQPAQGEQSVQAQLLPGKELPGFVGITGALGEERDLASPVYLSFGSVTVEASPVGAAPAFPFTAYLPEGTALEAGRVLYQKNGQWLWAGLAVG